MIHEWQQPKPVFVVPNPDGFPAGPGLSFAIIDYGIETHLLWGVAYDADGAVWWIPQPFIRFQFNPSAGRVRAKEPDGE